MRYHERSPFVPITARPKLAWPNGAPLAIWVVLNVERFDEDLLHGTTITTVPKEPPDIANYSWHEYGMRVGIWRLFQILDDLRIRGTVALHSEACALYPEVVRACVERGWDLMAHGTSGGKPAPGMSEAEERRLIADSLAGIEHFSGQRPIGWLGPSLSETARTLELLVEQDVQYTADWVNDEQPHVLHAANGQIVAMPYSNEINDIGILLRRAFTGPDYAQLLRDQFDQLYEDAADTARVMCISLHPYIVGVPYRARHLKEALAYMRERSGAWFATGSEILAAYRQR